MIQKGSCIIHNERNFGNILIIDNLATNNKYKNLINLKFADYIQSNNALNDINKIPNISTVFHEGACADTMNYDVDYLIKNNYEYSRDLLKHCIANNIDFIYASSAAVYGSGNNGFGENDTEFALNPYAFSKLLFDRYVRNIIHRVNSKIIGLRYFNVFGQQEHHKGNMASIVYQMYNQIMNTGIIKLFKGTDGYRNGEQARDFIYVKDVAKVNLWCMDNDIASGIYNCGTGKATTFNEVAKAVIAAMGKGKIEYIDFPEQLIGKYQSFTQANTKKLLAAGYDGKFTNINDAVREYCNFLDEGGYY